MSDPTEIPLDQFMAPSVGDKPVDQGEMDAAVKYANQMKAQGISDADVEHFLSNVATGKNDKPQEISLQDFAQGVPKAPITPMPASPTQPSYLQQANNALAPLLAPLKIGATIGQSLRDDPMAPVQKLGEFGKDISNVAGEIGSYVKNYGPEHETVEPGIVTPEEQKAAQLMGVPTFNTGNGGFFNKRGEDGNIVSYHPPIYKMTPQERQELDDRTLKQWGFDPKAERERAANFAAGKFDENADPVANITANNAIGNWIQDTLNPKMAASKQYAAIQNTVQAQRILADPTGHSKEEVDAAKSLVDYYKSTASKGVVETTKDLLEEVKKDPSGKLGQLAASLEADPELLGLGKLRLGTLLNEGKIATLTADLNKAKQTADFTRRMQGLDKTGLDVLKEGQAESLATADKKVANLNKALDSTKKKELLGNVASEPVIGGLANVALDEQAQKKDHGFITSGSELTPLAQGAALGGLASVGEALKLIPKKGEVSLADFTRPKDTPPGDKAPTGPGEPLHPETPINKENHVPYYGGVDATGKTIHIDENTPDNLPMKNAKGDTVNVPVTKLVAWHERVEFPLMHMEGPMSVASMKEMLDGVKGEGTIPQAVLDKLKKGESLSYPEAHEIATLRENARVRSLYGVDPKVYQDGLKPYIKQVAKDNKTQPASNIPDNLDKKPYQDMGGTESLKGQGSTPESLAKNAAMVGGVATGGAAVGAALNPDDREKGAKEGMFLPLISKMMKEGGEEALRTQKVLNDAIKRGVSTEEIWQKHGYYQDPRGNWIREISDQGLNIKKWDAKPGETIPLKNFADHPELEKEYPELYKDLKVKFNPKNTPPSNAAYDPKTNTVQVHPNVWPDILAHEIQHAIQEYEGLPRGSSPKYIAQTIFMQRDTALSNLKMINAAVNSYRNIGKEAPPEMLARLQRAREKFESYPKDDKDILPLAYARYRQVIGEAQAFSTGDRFYKSAEERRDLFPNAAKLEGQWETNDHGKVMGHELLETNKLPNEDEHIRLAAAGDQRSIGALYTQYMPRLTKVMNGFMREAGPRLGLSGEDIAQQAFFKAIKALPDFKKGSSFYTWLYSIGRNEALNTITDAGREVKTESMFKGGGGPGGDAMSGGIEDTGSDPIKPSVQAASSTDQTPEAKAAAGQISQLVRQTIATLPKQYADVLRLHELEGMTNVEIARELGMNVGTVNVYMSRGRDYLAKAFKGTETERLFKSQAGFADPELLKGLAKFAVLAGTGAAIGANYFDPQHPYKSMVQGAALALMAGQVKWGNLFSKFKDGMRYDPDVSVTEHLNQYDWDLARGDRLTASTRYAIDGLVKTEESRIKIARYLDGDRSVQLTPEETKAAGIARSVYDQVGQQALQAGVLSDFLDNYINHEWKPTPKREELLRQMHDAFNKQPNMSPKDRHALTRKFTSLADGKAAGLEPVSEDVNVLIDSYVKSITRAMANKNLLESLKEAKGPDGQGLVQRAGKAPYSYVPMSHSQLASYRVHPSIAPSLEFLYHTQGGNAIVQGVEAMNTALKRVQVSLSLFHAKSLIDAAAGAMEFSHPIRNLVDIAKSAFGKSRGHEQYLNGSMGDDVDHLIRALKITPRSGTLPVEDVTSGFYEGLKTLQNSMDSAIPRAGKITVGPVVQLSKALDHLLWENLHSGLKLVVGMNALERLRRSYARDFERDPNAHIPSTAELADRASSFTNDIFGGLNWRRLADDANTKWGREVANGLANPTARRIGQVMIFAPDWTYSTVRSVVKAIGKGSGVEGLIRPKQVADLHRLYLIRSAFIYATLYNGINMALSGHPIWDNKRNGKPEPFLLDLGNGEWAQANKHAMEVPNMVTHPAKWAMGKLGNLPSEVAEQALGKEYLSPDYMPPMKEGRLAHAAKRILPFSGTSLLEQGPKEAVSSALGVPIYGHEKESPFEARQKKAEQSKARAEARKQKRIDSLTGGH